MSRLGVVIFGATGFTGKRAVEEIARATKKFEGLTWGIAGRSKSKLESVLQEVSKKTGEDHTSAQIIIADVNDEKSLIGMCNQAKVIADCCGPYRLYGEPVVKAAIDCKTHYVDITGEPQFMETMQLVYNKAAQDAGVYVITACGFDCIPNDMGVVFLEQNFGGTLNTVESYFKSYRPAKYALESLKSGSINYGTWESLIYAVANISEIKSIRRKLYPEPMPAFKPKLDSRSVIHHNNNGWCLPFPGYDASVVYRTQRHLYETDKKRPVQFNAYVKAGNVVLSTLLMLYSGFIFLMTRANFTTKLLLDYPRFFSCGVITKEGPKDEVSENVTFDFTLHGEGWAEGTDLDSPPNKKVIAKVSGVNPGYGATVTALIYSAITVLNEQDKMPGTGGVLTTGAAFYKTNLIKNLHENNLKFEIVNNKQ